MQKLTLWGFLEAMKTGMGVRLGEEGNRREIGKWKMESVLRSDLRISEARKLAMIGAVTSQLNSRRGRCSPWSCCRRFACGLCGEGDGRGWWE